MSRMSLDDAKMVLRNRGYMTIKDRNGRYIIAKDRTTNIIRNKLTGREVVKIAKETMNGDGSLVKERFLAEEARREMEFEMRSNFEPGTTVVNVLTGERTRV